MSNIVAMTLGTGIGSAVMIQPALRGSIHKQVSWSHFQSTFAYQLRLRNVAALNLKPLAGYTNCCQRIPALPVPLANSASVFVTFRHADAGMPWQLPCAPIVSMSICNRSRFDPRIRSKSSSWVAASWVVLISLFLTCKACERTCLVWEVNR